MPLTARIFASIIIVLATVAGLTIYYLQTQQPVDANSTPTPRVPSLPTGSGTLTETSAPTQTITTSTIAPSDPLLSASPQLTSSSSLTPSSSLGSTSTPQTTSPNPTSPSSTNSASASPSPDTNTPSPSGTLTPGTSTYVVLAWNDLGMHCYNPDFKDICVLPPYNNLVAQVLRKSGEDAQLVTSGVTVSYFFPSNTYSTGKTNFWTYVNQTFNTALAANVGLTGKGLSGTMDKTGTYYEAKGIPLTEYTDQNPTTRQPFQQATVIVTNSANGAELCRTQVVAPVSTEMRCDTCHGDKGIATIKYSITLTNKTDTNILVLHDKLHPQTPSLMSSRPVLCANCHSDNALSTAGKANIPSLSNAMHSNHNNPSIPIANDTSGCYNCHPGPITQCLRDVMSQKQGFQCQNCHGDLAKVSTNSNPWLNEPRCDSPACHGGNATLGLVMNNVLYKSATGMGGVYCEACHDSTHAIAPSRVAADDVKFVALQGSPNGLATCTVCHAQRPDDPFFHSGTRNTTNISITSHSLPITASAILATVSLVAIYAYKKKHKFLPHFSSN